MWCFSWVERKMKISRDEIAAVFGLDKLQPGRHTIRDSSRYAIDEQWVSRIWTVQILPSFNESAMLAAISTRDWEYSGKKHIAETRSAFLLENLGGVLVSGPVGLTDDPVAKLLQKINVYPEEEYLSLDRISYHTSTQQCELEADIYFSNPRNPGPLQVESAFFSFAKKLFEADGRNEFRQYLAPWQRYLDR